ncbi:MAG TPA: hypothetical protein VGQ03_08905 [Nitrososphaera sp.]|jgi:hypothetical protein|nr:hypothetical protein [Nitrososphaera sp.]
MGQSDPAPLPYGGLQYYQVHYIVSIESEDNHNLLARSSPITQGHFKNKRVVGVKWVGAGSFADRLQDDSKLSEMLKEVLLREGEIRVDPQDDHIRIHGKWLHEDKLAFSETMFEIADRIAMHVRHKDFDMGVKS